MSLTRRYTHFLASTGSVATVHRPQLCDLIPAGSHAFQIALEPRRSGPPAVAVLHDGSHHVGQLPPEVSSLMVELLQQLGRRARRFWVEGEINEHGVELNLPTMEQIKTWMR